MASEQLKQMNELYTSIKERLSNPDIDLVTRRDIAENAHLAAAEPEAVTYAEVNAGGVPALWCVPAGYDPDRVLLPSHAGGTVVTSMHTDPKGAWAHSQGGGSTRPRRELPAFARTQVSGADQ